MARATNDLSAVRDVLGPGIMYFLNTIASVSMALVLMFRIDPMLTAVAVLPFPILAFAVQRFAVTLHIRSRDVQDQFGVMNNMLQEDLSGIRVIKSYVKESQEQELFARLNEDYRDKNLSLIRARALFFATMALLVGVGQLILLWLGGIRIMGGQISLGGFVAFNGYLALMTWPFIALGWVMAMVQRGEASMARLAEIINATPTIISPPSAHHSRTTHGELVFENVSLVYPGATHPSLEDVSFTIPTGATVAIVGRTGSGKSSLIRLAVRLFDPTKGRILLDGIDLKEWDLASLRKKIGVVLQESFLWSDTLAGNLRFADPEAAEEDLDRVSALARLDKDMNQFPEGWETRVGERGVTLSGGQRQRVALARALMKPPPILILDDTLSSLDNITQAEILSNLDPIKGNQTLVLISHRISLIRRAETIFVMDRGRLVESGSHEELSDRGGTYSQLIRRQTLLQQLEADAFPEEAS